MSSIQKPYIVFSGSQLDKIGNTMVYLSEKISNLSKTKLLKLLYILDETSIRNGGIPFINLTYKVWKFGPVSEDIYIDLSSENEMGRLSGFIKKTSQGYIIPNKPFSDDEFSDNDIRLLDEIIENYRHVTAKDLISYTHRKDGLWYKTAQENNVLDLLETQKINNTEIIIDMGRLVADNTKKSEIYAEFIECN